MNKHPHQHKPAAPAAALRPAEQTPLDARSFGAPAASQLVAPAAGAPAEHSFAEVVAYGERPIVQAKLIAAPPADQRAQPGQALQASPFTLPAGDRVIQAQADPQAGQPAAAAAQPNQTGLPEALKSGVEALSGLSLDSVRVHYGSPQPAQLSALAYAQGSDIHIAPGQEQHLPHEAWHVVQQAQGRVRPTLQLKGAVAANDDAGLEHEADVMGRRALAIASDPARPDRPGAPLPARAADPVQLKKLTTMGGTFDTGQYEAVTGLIEVKENKHTQDVGGVIDMSFSANEQVSGDFGLVQTAKAIRNERLDIDPRRTELRDRVQGADGLDPGRFLDRSRYKENPIFGLHNQLAPLGNLADGQEISFMGDQSAEQRNALTNKAEGGSSPSGVPAIVAKEADEKDHNISDVMGRVGSRTAPDSMKPASMRDEPQRTRYLAADEKSGDAIRMEFETAALVLSGDMEGTYLGSVQWGFQIGKTDQAAKPLPFEIVSMGTPTRAFMESASAWNDQAIVESGGGGKSQSLPVHVTNHAPDLALQKLLADESAAKAEKIKALQARIDLLSRVQEAIDPSIMERLKQAVADATARFAPVKLAIETHKREQSALYLSMQNLRDKRDTARKDQEAGKADHQQAVSNLDRIGNKTPFYKARKEQDQALEKVAAAKLKELEAAYAAAAAAVKQAEQAFDSLPRKITELNQSKEVADQRQAKADLQNEKADLANVSFELSNLLKALDQLQSEAAPKESPIDVEASSI